MDKNRYHPFQQIQWPKEDRDFTLVSTLQQAFAGNGIDAHLDHLPIFSEEALVLHVFPDECGRGYEDVCASVRDIGRSLAQEGDFHTSFFFLSPYDSRIAVQVTVYRDMDCEDPRAEEGLKLLQDIFEE